MNKYLLGLVALCFAPMSAFAANNLSQFDDRVPLSEKLLREYKTETPNVVYRDRKQADRVGRYYAGLNGDISFLTWKNKYRSDVVSDSEKFTFKTSLGADIAVGYRFDKKWRVDGELGYVGKYTEKETEDYGYITKTEFSLETYYINANAYYDLAYGLYAGLGAGLAIVDLTADDTEVSGVSKTNLSPMGVAMLGWSYLLDEKVDLDIRYRFAIFDGGDLDIGGVNVDAGMVMNNSLSVGVRYHF